MHNIKNPKLILIFLASIGLDMWSKKFMASWLKLGQSEPVIPGFFSFTLVHNKGAAFGVGSSWSVPVFLLFSVVALAVVSVLFYQLKPHEKLSAYGLSMILGGAFGNIVDRIRLGYVVDFLDVYVKTHHWPVFNLADTWITIGAVLLGVEIFFCNKTAPTTGQP
ncbi:MAG: signal peptidase II [Bdellovibrionota bacterium]